VSTDLFALTAAASRGELWRLWTGHLVHYDIAHVVTNAIAIAVPLALVDRRNRRAILLSLILIAPAISLVLLAGAHFDEYRGASGLALAVWVASALSLLRARNARDRCTGGALLVIAAAKLLAEMAGVGHVWERVAPLPLAHVAGAIAGMMVWGVGERREVADRATLQPPLPTPHSPIT
jgi:rhomboid family GlyGly-CTERM serine protease